MTSDHRTSLRALARALGCSHAALSQRIHSGQLTAGVGIDARGRAVVVDPDAAAEEWARIHVPGVHELTRPVPRAPSAGRSSAWTAPAPGPDPAPFVWTWLQLRNHSDALGLITRVLVAEALERMPPAEFIERVTARMPAAGYGFGDDAEIRADAERELAELVNEVIDPLGARSEELDEP